MFAPSFRAIETVNSTLTSMAVAVKRLRRILEIQ